MAMTTLVRRWYDGAAIEVPRVGAAVTVVGEVLLTPTPTNFSRVGGHAANFAALGVICKVFKKEEGN